MFSRLSLAFTRSFKCTAFALGTLAVVTAGVVTSLPGEASAAGRLTVRAANTAPSSTRISPETALLSDARLMYSRRVTADRALNLILAHHGASLVAAEAALATAGYGPAARAEAVQMNFTLETATAEIAQEGWSPRDTYLELRGSKYAPEASAISVIDYYSPASTEEVAEAMLSEGVPIDEIIGVLRYAGYSVAEIWDFLRNVAGETPKNALAWLLKTIDASWQLTSGEIHFLKSQLQNLFATASDAGEWLRGQVGMTWEQAAELLIKLGYTAEQIAAWLKDKVGASADVIAAFLSSALGLNLDDTFEVLHKVGFKMKDSISAVVEVFGATAQKVARLLAKSGIKAAHAIHLLIGQFGTQIVGQLYSLLVGGLYSASEAGEAVAAYTQSLIQSSTAGLGR